MTSSTHLGAITRALAGFTFWVGADVFIKLASTLDTPKYQVVGIAAISGMIVLFAMAVVRGQVARLRPQHYKGLTVLGFLMILTYVAGIFGLQRLPIATYYAIVFMSPIVVSLLAAKFLHEKMKWQKIVAVVVGFIGVLIAVDVFSMKGGDWIGYGFAVLCMTITVMQQFIMRYLHKRETGECTSFYPRIGPIVACMIAAAMWGIEPMSAEAIFYSVMVGAIGSLGWFYVAEAYKRAQAGTIAPYQYSQIVSGALFGYAIWGDIPSVHLLVGAAIITAAGVYIALHTRWSKAVHEIVEI